MWIFKLRRDMNINPVFKKIPGHTKNPNAYYCLEIFAMTMAAIARPVSFKKLLMNIALIPSSAAWIIPGR